MLRELAGQRVRGYVLRVYSYCTPTEPGTYDAALRIGHLKVTYRAARILERLQAFAAQGVPPERLFLAGHSTGAWSALIVARRAPASLNAVIAFAPAFAGRLRTRSLGWWWIRQRQVDAFLLHGEPLPALLYAFPGDAFETPETLAFFRQVPGVRMAEDDPACFQGHLTPFAPCFQRQAPVLLRYLEARLDARGVAPRQPTPAPAQPSASP